MKYIFIFLSRSQYFVTIIINADVLLLYSRVEMFALSDHFKLSDKLEAIKKYNKRFAQRRLCKKLVNMSNKVHNDVGVKSYNGN